MDHAVRGSSDPAPRPVRLWLVALALAPAVAACGSSSTATVVCLDHRPTRDPSHQDRPPPAVARVDRCPIALPSFRFGVNMTAGRSPDRRQRAMDALIARELLAQGAQDAGVRPPRRSEVERRIAHGQLYALGQPLPVDLVMRDGVFDYQAYQQVAQLSGLSAPAMTAEQAREWLARTMMERLGDPEVPRWVGERCRRALAAGRLTVDESQLAELDPDGDLRPVAYQPCAAWP